MKKIQWWFLKRKFKIQEETKVEVKYEDNWYEPKQVRVTIFKHFSELKI